ncbi:hypothetical protein [Mesorhizobium argentiipisi]|uniref:hypothetical protein n=1 Tax=Mesorhizobium argentiipisi TaxID=3015175 RepID=UPI00301D1BB3
MSNESGLGVGHDDQASPGDRDAERVVARISQHLLRSPDPLWQFRQHIVSSGPYLRQIRPPAPAARQPAGGLTQFAAAKSINGEREMTKAILLAVIVIGLLSLLVTARSFVSVVQSAPAASSSAPTDQHP